MKSFSNKKHLQNRHSSHAHRFFKLIDKAAPIPEVPVEKILKDKLKNHKMVTSSSACIYW